MTGISKFCPNIMYPSYYSRLWNRCRAGNKRILARRINIGPVQKVKLTDIFWTKFDNFGHCGPCFTLANQGLIHLTGSSDLDRVLTGFGKFTDGLANSSLVHLLSFHSTYNKIVQQCGGNSNLLIVF